MTMGTVSPTGFAGIEVRHPALFLAALRFARIAQAIETGSQEPNLFRRAAASSSAFVADALLASSNGTCALDAPPSEVDRITDPETRWMILRCRHDPRHRWRLDGEPI